MSATASAGQRLGSFFRNRRVRTVIFVLGGYKLYTTATTYNTLYKTFSAHRHRPGQTVLDLDLDAVQLISASIPTPFTTAEEMRLEHLVATLDAAKADPRVTGLVVRGLGALESVGLAEVTELRNVIKDFSTGWGGKQTMLHIPEGLGGAGNGTIPLYFASAFDSVHVQPTSGIIIPGLSGATLFFKKLLENVGLKAKTVARKEFKTAANNFTEEKFTDPHRQSTEALLSAVMNEVVKGVSEGRGISEEKVRNAMDTGIMSAQEAMDRGIVDQSLYRDELPGVMREKLEAAAAKRAEAREEAALEWREAMAELRQIWSLEGGASEVWANGDLVQHAVSVEESIPLALSFGDQRQEITKKTTDAEIRALKAHLRWLDTCPWEAVGKEGEGSDLVFRTVANIASILDVERRICATSLEALEKCPALLESLRKDADDGAVLKLNQESSLSLIRWCRSMWTAKCMAARIVGTLKDAEEALSKVSEANIDDARKEAVLEVANRPRIFLMGFLDDVKVAASSLVEPALPAPVDTLKADKEQQLKAGPKRSRNLRYVKLSDYAETLNSEMRAVIDRSSSFIRFESTDPLHKLPGTIDAQERNALLRLQLPGHRLSPWRFKIPKGDIIAVITVQGAISDDRANATRAAIRRAEKDPNVKAMVLRVDSPGGSATASDLISRAVEVAKKPVVASMGSVCASGGYFISAPCDKVFASNMTITGSIGVIFSAVNTAGLFDKVGVTADSVETARFSKYFGAKGSISEWSEEFSSRIDQVIDNFYSDFVKVVARGRGMKFEQAERIARGRVWAGSDALSLGLVDEIGGLRAACKAAAELAHLAPDGNIRAIDYPTVGMQVQDAARKRGLMPSNLDEEGDESLAKRRRSWFTLQPPDREESDAPEKPADGAVAAVNLLTNISLGAVDAYEGLLAALLSRMDRYLVAASASSPSTQLVEYLLGQMMTVIGNDRQVRIFAKELDVAQATAGRPSAIAPSVHIDE